MAYPKTRSANAELHEGMTDGTYRKVVMDRGGVVESLTYEARKDLSDAWSGIHEKADKVLPDGRMCRTPYAVSTPEADPEAF